MSEQIPTTVDEISCRWLTDNVRASGYLKDATAINAEITRIGEGAGLLSSVAKVVIDYDRPEDAALASVVVKITTDVESFREAGEALHAFEREIRFYRDVAHHAPIRLPRPYYALEDPPSFAMILEDLTFYTAGDQIAGMHTEQVLATVRLMARLQAKFWDNPALERLDWMPRSNGIEKEFGTHWPSFARHFGDSIGADGIEVGEGICAADFWLEQEMQRSPSTIVHCDLRADNLLFGPPDSDDSVLIIDWQLAIRGMGAFDVARILGGSEPPEERRGHQFEVLRAWHETLVEEGVHDYSWEDAVRSFRIGALSTLTYAIRFHADALALGGRARLLIETIVRRSFSDAVEIDALSVLR